MRRPPGRAWWCKSMSDDVCLIPFLSDIWRSGIWRSGKSNKSWSIQQSEGSRKLADWEDTTWVIIVGFPHQEQRNYWDKRGKQIRERMKDSNFESNIYMRQASGNRDQTSSTANRRDVTAVQAKQGIQSCWHVSGNGWNTTETAEMT